MISKGTLFGVKTLLWTLGSALFREAPSTRSCRAVQTQHPIAQVFDTLPVVSALESQPQHAET